MDTKSAAWHEERRKAVGGSDWDGILSIEPYGCRREVWLSKLGTEPISKAETPEMRRGTVLEPIVAQEYEARSGRKTRKASKRNTAGAHASVVGGNPDYIIIAGDDGKGPGVLECKTSSRRSFEIVCKQGPWLGHVAQLQHYMSLTGYQWGALAYLCPDSWDMRIFPMDRDVPMLDAMQQAAETFWDQVDGVAPPPEPLPASDRRCVRCRYRDKCHPGAPDSELLPVDCERVTDPTLAALVGQERDLQAIKRAADEEITEVRSQIKATLGEKRDVAVKGWRLKVGGTYTSLDVQAIARDLPEVYGKYKRTTKTDALKIYNLKEDGGANERE
jgi:predicted phage-related endonuclease